MKPTPTYPGNFRCGDSLREASVAQGRRGSRPLLPGLGAGAQPGGHFQGKSRCSWRARGLQAAPPSTADGGGWRRPGRR